MYCYVVIVRRSVKRFLLPEEDYLRKKSSRGGKFIRFGADYYGHSLENGAVDFEFVPEESGIFVDGTADVEDNLINVGEFESAVDFVCSAESSAKSEEDKDQSLEELSRCTGDLNILEESSVGSFSLDDADEVTDFEDSRLFRWDILSHDRPFKVYRLCRKELKSLNRSRLIDYTKVREVSGYRLRRANLKRYRFIKRKLKRYRVRARGLRSLRSRISLRMLKDNLSLLSGGMNVKLFFVNGVVLSKAILEEGQQFALWDSFDFWHRTKGFARLFFSAQTAFFGFSAAVLAECVARLLFRERRQSYLLSCVNSLVLFFWSHAKYVRGVKIILTGLIDGRDRAKQKIIKYGKVPVNTLAVYVDYAALSFYNIRGAFGLRVFITHSLDFDFTSDVIG